MFLINVKMSESDNYLLQEMSKSNRVTEAGRLRYDNIFYGN